MAYAARTSVSVEKSRLEIEKLCLKHGCTKYASAMDHSTGTARIQFHAHARIVRFELQLPISPEAPRHHAKWEQACRARWRALVLVLKAKLEAIQSSISTFEEEFMPFIVLPNDQTVGAVLHPMIEEAYKGGRMPKQLMIGDGK